MLSLATGATAQDWKTRLERPDQSFFYYQLNASGGYDTREPGDSWGLADRGAPTQLTLEWFSKDGHAIQRGYTSWIAPSAWNVKLGFELDPAEREGGEPNYNLRLLDTWVRFDTRWDRTSFFLGNRSLPYGHNPRLDSEFTFLPNQAPVDLGFGRDLGFFFTTPVGPRLDLELAATAGGFLAGPAVAAVHEPGSGYEVDDRVDYRGSWLVTTRLGRPTFEAREIGVFAVAGKTHAATGPLTEVARLGADWVVKRGEDWTAVQQVSVGRNRGDRLGDRDVFNLLNNVEVFLGPRWRIGATHTWRREDLDAQGAGDREIGTLFGSISFALGRDARVRLNPFAEYRDSTGKRDSGALVQLCVGCGWRK